MKYFRALVGAFFLLFLSTIALAAPVNLNTADAAALAAGLNGVGPKIASAIIDYRTANGPFKSVEDLMNVKGIGPKILERNRANIVIKAPAKAAKK
jgi:competence protein ComEA